VPTRTVNSLNYRGNERYFDCSFEFTPERFLKFGVKEGIQDDLARRENMLFGGGRRVCLGIIFILGTNGMSDLSSRVTTHDEISVGI